MDQESLVETIARSGGLVMLVGPSDSGKTTLAKYLLSRLCLLRPKIGFIDGDVGQSSLGPPGTVGAAFFNRFDPHKDWEMQAKSLKLHFIGAFSPPGRTLEILIGLKKLVDYLQQSGCDIIIIDTTGLVYDRSGLYLKKSKIELLKPKHLVMLHHHNELQTLTAFLAKKESINCHTFSISQEVKKRSLEQRRFNREKKLQTYFAESRFYDIPFPATIQWKKNIITSTYCSPKEIAQLSNILQKEIRFAAISHRLLFIISDTWFYCDKIQQLQAIFPIDSIFILLAPNLIDSFVSLENSNDDCLTLGVVKNIDFKNHIISLQSPAHKIENIYSIKFGATRLKFFHKESGVQIVEM